MRTWFRRALSLNSLNKALGFGNVFAALKFDMHILSAEKIGFKKVLVLAPHADDDVFGLGGTIKKLTTAGSEVTVVYLTDGSGGVPEVESEIGEKSDKNLAQVRKEEAKKSAEILGAKETIFWGYRDGKLASGHSAVRALLDLLDQVQPEVIFVPSFLDNHPDHRAANEILINAIPNLKEEQQKMEIWAYEVWTPIFPNRLVDITLYIKTKQEAMAAHESQLLSRRYNEAVVALNKYRAEINNVHGFTEAFFAAPIKLYKELYEKS